MHVSRPPIRASFSVASREHCLPVPATLRPMASLTPQGRRRVAMDGIRSNGSACRVTIARTRTKILPVCLASLTMVLTVTLHRPTVAHASGVRLSLIPAMGSNMNPPSAFLSACENLNQWPQVAQLTSYLGVAEWALSRVSDDSELSSCFHNMYSNHMQLVLEEGVVKPGCVGSGCFNNEHGTMDRAMALGANPLVFAFDDPLAGGMGSPNYFS